MNKNTSYKLVSIAVCSLVICFAVAFYAFGWTEPTVTPPGGNVSAPLNVSSTGQSKAGGLILNTGGATNGLIVQTGNVGIGVTPTQKLDVNGTIKATGLQIPGGSSGKVLAWNTGDMATWQTPSATPPITIITCATKVGDNGFTGSSSAAGPAGTVIRFFAETGHAEHNTDWNDDQYCRTWVSQATYGIQCNVVVNSAPGCGGSGMGVCW